MPPKVWLSRFAPERDANPPGPQYIAPLKYAIRQVGDLPHNRRPIAYMPRGAGEGRLWQRAVIPIEIQQRTPAGRLDVHHFAQKYSVIAGFDNGRKPALDVGDAPAQ
jgi:hypothetical protein